MTIVHDTAASPDDCDGISQTMEIHGSPALMAEVARRDRTIIAMSAIDLAVAIFGVGRIELLGHRRTARLTRARFALAAVLVEVCGASSTEAGKFLNRDHSSILHALSRHEDCLAIDADYSAHFQTLRAATFGVRERQSGVPSAFVAIERKRLIANLQGAISAISIIEPTLAKALQDVVARHRTVAPLGSHGPVEATAGKELNANSVQASPDRLPDGGPAKSKSSIRH